MGEISMDSLNYGVKRKGGHAHQNFRKDNNPTKNRQKPEKNKLKMHNNKKTTKKTVKPLSRIDVYIIK